MSKLRIIIVTCLFCSSFLGSLKAEEPSKLSYYSNTVQRFKHKIFSELNALNIEGVYATYTYSNSTSGTLSNQTSCATSLQRTFSVTDNFTVNDLNIGLNMAHTWRGDVQITLTSPSNTSVVIVAFSSDYLDGYDILIDDESGNALNDGSNDNNSAPNYGSVRTADPSNA